MIRRACLVLVVLGTLALSGLEPSAGRAAAPGAHGALAAHRLWVQRVSPNADSAPAYLARIGSRRVGPIVYVLGGNNDSDCNPGNPVTKATLYALNASNGSIRWTASTSGPSRCTTAGPVVDPSGRWVFAPGLDGTIHRYNSLTGKETKGAHWPVAYTLMPDVEKGSSTPTISGRSLYVTTSGFIGDQGHYQGHLVTIDLTSGARHVFNSLCSTIHTLLGPSPSRSNYCPDERSGMFGRGQGVVDPVTHAVYVVTGNGAWNGKTNWGDSILKLDASGSRLLDSFTPTNQAELDASDLDLGSTGPALLPSVQSGGRTYHLLVQGGKGPACAACEGAAIRLLNRDNLSGHGAPGNLGGDLNDAQAPGGCAVLTAPAAWKAQGGAIWVFYANSCGLAGYRLAGSGGSFRLDRVWTSSAGGTTPVMSAGVLYVASGGRITAYDPPTGKVLLRISGIGGIHWEYPRIAGERLFISDENGRVFAYGLSG